MQLKISHKHKYQEYTKLPQHTLEKMYEPQATKSSPTTMGVWVGVVGWGANNNTNNTHNYKKHTYTQTLH